MFKEILAQAELAESTEVEKMIEEGMEYEEIAKELGISVAKVKKIEASALKKLRAPTKKNKALRDAGKFDNVAYKAIFGENTEGQ